MEINRVANDQHPILIQIPMNDSRALQSSVATDVFNGPDYCKMFKGMFVFYL